FEGTPTRTPRLTKVFQRVEDTKQAAFIPYLTAGYPKKGDTVDLLLALQEGGADVIELGVPFSDPQADGPTIQATNEIALKNNVTVSDCLDYVRDARTRGLTTPVVLMSYLNPLLAYGLDKLVMDTKRSGADGFLVVDLLPERAHDLVAKCRANKLSFIPLATPATPQDRIPLIASVADSFIYCVSVAGVTGARSHLPPDLERFLARVRAATDKPLSVGFGISSAEQVKQVAAIADGVVVGSAFMNAIDERNEAPTAGGPSRVDAGYFGSFGGSYIPETVVQAHRALMDAYSAAMADPKFHEELTWYRQEYTGGPTPLHYAKRLTAANGGAQIWLKREEAAHTGGNRINSAIGQALLAKRVGLNRIVSATGSGQQGVAAATACALFGMESIIYMGAVDCERQDLNVLKMKTLGAKVVPVHSGGRKLKDAMNEAMRDCVTNVADTFYMAGSAVGSHPFPTIVRDLQSVVGREARSQIIERTGTLPDFIVACVGGGGSAIGIFHPFMQDVDAGHVKLVGVEAGGSGTRNPVSAASLTRGSPGILHGTRSYLLQNENGQVDQTHSVAAGLDYPGVGPEHAWLKHTGRAEYVAVKDEHAVAAVKLLARTEGLIAGLEPAHGIHHAMEASF
ncbi:unnamed protein product, partial [Scytosiphon promiscuus]